MRLLLFIFVISFTAKAQAVGELFGSSRRLVAVDRQTLHIDFRPLHNSAEAKIEAIYKIVNSGETKTEELFLPVQAAEVEFDSLPVTLKPVELKLPLDFRPPDTTPGLAQQPPVYYSVPIPKQGLSFTLTVSPGQHQLRVAYAVRPRAQNLSSPSLFWQMGYVLAPARQWASHGGLDLYIYLPPNWEGTCNLPVQRGRDMLVGAWNSLPQDNNIAITLRQTPPPLLRYSYAAVASGLLLSVFGTLLLGHLGWLQNRLFTSIALVTAASTTIFTTSYMLDLLALQNALGTQLSDTYNSGIYSASTLAALFYLFICSATVAHLKRKTSSYT